MQKPLAHSNPNLTFKQKFRNVLSQTKNKNIRKKLHKINDVVLKYLVGLILIDEEGKRISRVFYKFWVFKLYNLQQQNTNLHLYTTVI